MDTSILHKIYFGVNRQVCISLKNAHSEGKDTGTTQRRPSAIFLPIMTSGHLGMIAKCYLSLCAEDDIINKIDNRTCTPPETRLNCMILHNQLMGSPAPYSYDCCCCISFSFSLFCCLRIILRISLKSGGCSIFNSLRNSSTSFSSTSSQ